MKKVEIFFKSGNKLVFKCKNFEFKFDKETNTRDIKIDGSPFSLWMIDANEIESLTVIDF